MNIKSAPLEVQELVKYAVNKGGADQEAELVKYYDIYYNTKAASGPKYHQNSPDWDSELTAKVNSLRKPINLIKPSVRYFISQIYSGQTQRRIDKTGYDKFIQKEINEVSYHNRVVTATQIGYVFGRCCVVPIVGETPEGDRKLSFWMPNPVRTELAVNPNDIDDKQHLIEYFKDDSGRVSSLRFLMKGWMGYFDVRTQEVELQMAPSTYLPIAMSLGESLYPMGIPSGKTLIEPAFNASITVTHHNLMLEIMKSMIAHNIVVTYGEPLESGDDQQGKSLQPMYSFNMIEGRKEGDIEIKSFPSKLQDIINLKRSSLETLSVEMGIPLDIFLPTETSSLGDASATAARTKALPATAQAKMRLDQAHQFEKELVQAILIALVFEDSGIDVSYSEVFQTAEIDIQIIPSEAISYAESVASSIQLLDAGLARKEDIIRKFNPALSNAEIEKMLDQNPAAQADL